MEQLAFASLEMEIFETTVEEDKGDMEVNFEEKETVSPKKTIRAMHSWYEQS